MHLLQELPQLPVPDLWLTVSRYLSSLRAILAPSTDEPASAREREARRQFEQTNKLVHSFMLHEGPQLQRDLKDYASKRQNWVSIEKNRLQTQMTHPRLFRIPRRDRGHRGRQLIRGLLCASRFRQSVM